MQTPPYRDCREKNMIIRKNTPNAPCAPRRGNAHIAQGNALGWVLLAFQAVRGIFADNHLKKHYRYQHNFSIVLPHGR